MRKIVAFILGFSLVFTLGYMTLAPSYLLVADWIGPVVGPSILTALTVIFVLLGDPLKYIGLALIWTFTAFLVGLIVRKRVGAVLTMLAVFSIFLPFLALNIYSMVEPISALSGRMESDDFFSVIPPLPGGMSFAHITGAPVVGEVFESVMGMMQMGEMGNPWQVISSMIIPFGIGVIEKVALIFFASLIGAEVGIRLGPSLAPYSDSLRARLGGKPVTDSGTSMDPINRFKAIGVMLLLLLPLIADPLAATGAGDDYYSENLIGYMDTDGRAFVGNVFISSEAATSAISWASSEADGLLAAFMLSQEGVKEIVPQLQGMEDMAEILGPALSLIPDTMLAVVYVNVPMEVASLRSEAISEIFSNAFDAELDQFIALPISTPYEDEAIEPLEGTVVLYQSPMELSDFAGLYLEDFTQYGGLTDVVGEAVSNGRLIPGATVESAEGSVMFTGYINMGLLGELFDFEQIPSSLTQFLPDDLAAPIGLAGGVAYWEQGYVKEGDESSFDVLSLLGTEETPAFSDESDLSTVLLVPPDIVDGDEEEIPQLKVTTTLDLNQIDPSSDISSMIDYTHVPSGETILESGFSFAVEDIFLPLMVSVTKDVSRTTSSKNSDVEVTVTVRNDDSDAMVDVRLDDGDSLKSYTWGASLSSGSTAQSWTRIGPGETRTITYTVRLSQEGVYSLGPASLEYSHEDLSFSAESNSLEVEVPQPNPLGLLFTGLRTAWGSSAGLLDITTGGQGSMILMAITLLVFCLLAFLEYRNLRKWLTPGPGAGQT